MKKIFLFMCSMAFSAVCQMSYAQTTMVVHKVDGTTMEYNVSDVDSVTFVENNGIYTIDGHEFIDLCLPSGLLWATTNVGAELPADIGNYYAWSETAPKDKYTTENQTRYDTTTNSYTKYNTTDNKKVLEAEDDAASVNWGTSCRMPTYAEYKELKENCTVTEETRTNSNGESVTGALVTSKTDSSRSMFIPLSGYMPSDFTSEKNSKAYFWTSTRDTYASKAYYWSVTKKKFDQYTLQAHPGMQVRAVANKK